MTNNEDTYSIEYEVVHTFGSPYPKYVPVKIVTVNPNNSDTSSNSNWNYVKLINTTDTGTMTNQPIGSVYYNTTTNEANIVTSNNTINGGGTYLTTPKMSDEQIAELYDKLKAKLSASIGEYMNKIILKDSDTPANDYKSKWYSSQVAQAKPVADTNVMAKLEEGKKLRAPGPARKYAHNPTVDGAATKKQTDQHGYTITPENVDNWVDDPGKANLITSLTESGRHAPVIDIDLPIQVYPSSQLGHNHLYIDSEITWTKYVRLLKALEAAGIIEKGYLEASLKRGYTAVRPVGVVKAGAPKGVEILKENAQLRQENYRMQLDLVEAQKGLGTEERERLEREIAILREEKELAVAQREKWKLRASQLSIEVGEERKKVQRIEADNLTRDAELAEYKNRDMPVQVNRTTWG